MIVDVSTSKANLEKVRADFDKVIAYSQDYGFDLNTKNLFEAWFEAKRDFIEAWGGKMIIEAPKKITFELSEKDKDTRLNEFIDVVSTVFENETLANFIESNRAGFFVNKVVEEWENTDTGEYIPYGMKLIKAFKFFEEDALALKELQTRASMIIQEDKVEGTLCFSVHPLDFLSSSENTYNWRSCHALDGEYRAGNLSYMVDSSTIMCYLKGIDNTVIPNFPTDVLWNSKKWRMLLFFSEQWDVLFAGRQYPFFSRNALNIILDHLNQIDMCKGYWSNWHDDQIGSYRYKEDHEDYDDKLMWNYVCISNELFRVNDIIIDNPHSLHFNDLLRSSCYKPYYCYRYYRWSSTTPKISIGGGAPCVRCGQDNIITTDSMLCEECELEYGSSENDMFGYCDCCDRRMIMDDSHYIESSGQCVCDWCYDTMTKTCDNCGNLYYNNEITYDKPSHSYLCQCCASNRGRRYTGSISAINNDLYSFELTYE